MVLGDGNVGPGMEHGFLNLSVAGDLLFVTAVEALDVQLRQQMLDFAVGQVAAFDASKTQCFRSSRRGAARSIAQAQAFRAHAKRP